MRRTALSVLMVCALLAPAGAEVIIARYGLEVDPPRASAGIAQFSLRLTYKVDGEVKKSGFKYVGTGPVTALTAEGPQGQPLRAESLYEARSGETRVEFDLPDPDPQGYQVVYLRFNKWLETTHGWGHRVARIPWAHMFRLPVEEMQVAVKLPRGQTVDGWNCMEGDKGTTCLRGGSGTQPVVLRIGPRPDPAGAGLFALAAAGLLAALVQGLRRRYQDLLTQKGVIPPASEVAYPDNADPYRAPPPLPPGGSLQPVLPPEDRRAFLRRAAVGLGTFVLCLGLLAHVMDGQAPVAMGILMIVLALPLSLVTWLFLRRDQGLYYLPVLSLATAGTLAYAWWVVVPLGIGSIAALREPKPLRRKAAATGGGGSGSGDDIDTGDYSISSSSSSPSSSPGFLAGLFAGSSSGGSSCGSSGGSSCGGGGGSSCGGGGGGCGGGGGGGGCGG